ILLFPVIFVVGCIGSKSDENTDSTESNFSSTPPASPDVPRYSGTNTDFWTIVKTSVDGAAFVEERTLSAVAPPDFAGANAWGFHTRPDLFVDFGVAGARRLEVGTYSCADGDAAIFSTTLNSDRTWRPLLRPATCTVVVDEITPAPASSYV